MCHYITLVAPTSDTARVRELMEEFGRTATPVTNASVGKVMLVGEHQFLTNTADCDCGTVLGRGLPEDQFEDDQKAEAARLTRKGWSPTKIARALADRQKAAERESSEPDSLDLWAEVLTALRQRLGLTSAGLLVHGYRGSIEEEAFDAVRKDIAATADLRLVLGELREDELHIFRAR